jgi:methylenetetrahydrofolate dehydrogenase (NADP+)/methenyltetrahydrofolate cyclohydrolase
MTMTATILDGKAIADVVMTGLAEQIHALGEPLHLAAVCIGDDAGLRQFVKLKQKAAVSIGAEFSSYFFDANDQDGAIQTLRFLAGDDSVHGIFTELPLPTSWDADALLSLIPERKDVDVLSPHARTKYYAGEGGIIPPSVLALQYVLRAHEISVRGTRVAVIGAGELVGKPIAHWLRSQGAMTDIVDIDTKHPEEITRTADIVIAAAGAPGLVTEEWIRDGAIVIDYGFGKRGDAYVGDVHYNSVHKKAGLLTPVPGGMGPLVVAAVLENLVTLSTI